MLTHENVVSDAAGVVKSFEVPAFICFCIIEQLVGFEPSVADTLSPSDINCPINSRYQHLIPASGPHV